MNKFVLKISLIIVLLTVLVGMQPKSAVADYGGIGAPWCASSGTHRGKLTFSITNTSHYTKTYQVTVGPHGDNNVRVSPYTTRYFTLQGIPDGVHAARLKYYGTTLATRYNLNFSCSSAGIGYDWATIGSAMCNASGTHRGRLQFTIRNNHSTGRVYRVTVGPHGDNNVYVAPNSTRYFTLHGIPSGVHTARVYFGNLIMSTKYNLNFACAVYTPDTASIGTAACNTTGTHRGKLTFTIRNNQSATRAYRVTVGPHGDNAVYVGANTTRNFTLHGIPSGVHTARVYYGSALLATRSNLTFSCIDTSIGNDSATIGAAACATSGGTHRGDLTFIIGNTHSTSRTYRVTVGPHGDNNVTVAANSTRYFTLHGIPAGVHTARVYFGNLLMSIRHNLNFSACAQIKYDDLGQAACHNCYEPQFINTLSAALDQNKAIEIDFYDESFNATPPLIRSMSNNWYVAHYQTHAHENNCSGDKTLKACLQDVKNWSDNNPSAEVVTVYLDKKQGWGTAGQQRAPQHLDALIDSIFPRNRLYTPADLKGNFTSVRSAAIANNWKTTADLRGKIIFVLTGGQTAPPNHNRTQHQYIDNRMNSARLFVAVDLDEQRDYNSTPEWFNATTAGFLVFYNQNEGDFNQSWTNQMRSRNFVTRYWWSGGSDAGRDFCSLMNKGITHPAFYHYWNNTGFIQSVNLDDPNNPCRLL